MIANYDMLSFNRPRDEINYEEASITNQSPDAIATWMRNRAMADPMINQSDKRLQTTMAEIAVLERLAKRKGHSYTNKESPSTMNAYYKSEWYALKRKQQELQQIEVLDRANERLLNSSDIPNQLVPSYINMVVNGVPKENVPKEEPKKETYTDVIHATHLQQKKERERQLQIANQKRRKEEIEQHNKLQEQKRIVELQEQRRLIEEEKNRKKKIAAHQEKVKRDKERQIKEKEALEKQRRLDKEAAIQKEKLLIEQKREKEPIGKQIDEVLSRKVKEQYRPPKDPPPLVSREEFDKAQQEKAERAYAIRMAKQNAEKLHRKLLEEKAQEKAQARTQEKTQETISEKQRKQLEQAALQSTPEYIEGKRKSDLASKDLNILFKNEAELHDTRLEFPHIYIILLCFNESIMLPKTIHHYRTQFPSCEFIIYDNESTDDSVIVAKELGCHVISWSSNQINDEFLKIKIRNHCWKHITQGWIIMADMDEWIYITEEELREEEEKGTTILSIEGLEMIGESQTLDFSDIELNEIKRYIPFSDESKNLCFFRSKITEMNFGPGSHTCKPQGIVVFSSKVYQLRHMCQMGLPFLLHKMKLRYERSALNRARGWSIHYINDEKKVTEKYNKLLSDSLSL